VVREDGGEKSLHTNEGGGELLDSGVRSRNGKNRGRREESGYMGRRNKFVSRTFSYRREKGNDINSRTETATGGLRGQEGGEGLGFPKERFS